MYLPALYLFDYGDYEFKAATELVAVVADGQLMRRR
jgi:hypothetical protein